MTKVDHKSNFLSLLVVKISNVCKMIHVHFYDKYLKKILLFIIGEFKFANVKMYIR